MISITSRRTICAAIFLASVSCSSLAVAQAIPELPTPPIRSPVDGNGVDMATGHLQLTVSELSIGSPGDQALAHINTWLDTGWRHGFDVTLTYTLGGAIVSIGGRTTTFTGASGGGYVADQGDGATLTASFGIRTYTAADGTVVIFDSSINRPGSIAGSIAIAGTSITLPTGELLSLSYKTATLVTPNPPGIDIYTDLNRIQSVTSNSGYQLKYEYESNTTPTDTVTAIPWLNLTKVTAINNAVDYCNPSADACAGLTQSWPSVTYTTATVGANKQRSVTDSLSRVTRYTTDSSGRLIGIKRPSSATDNVTIGYDAVGRVASVSNGTASWTYGWVFGGTTTTGTVTDPLSHQRVVTVDNIKKVILTDKDALNRTTTYLPDAQGRITKVTAPEGNYVQTVYDARGNVTSRTAVSKTPGTPASIVTSASYDLTCANLKTCNKPNSTTDARGNVTDYLYDAGTGLVTSVKSPAAASGGTRPETRYGYTALHAYYKNSAGSIVAAPTPIYQLTSVSRCVTEISCAGTANEVKSIVAYGATGVANNLLPTSVSSGSGDGALTATTAVTYDQVGNRRTIDGPLAGTADTTNFYYDAARQLTMVVGPDPDGGGALLNRATQLGYNTDGQVTSHAQGTANAAGTGFVSLQQGATTYDTLGRKIKDIATSGGTTYAVVQYSYDNANRLDCVAQRMNPAAFASPPAACTLGTTGSFGQDRIVKNSYNVADELTSVITGYLSTAQRTEQTMTYSANGKLATLADGKNNLTTYEYDGFDRLFKTRYPSPTSAGASSTTDYEQTTYDPASNITNRRLRDGQNATYAYDNLGRLSSRGGDAILARSFGYDLLGRMLSATFAVGGQSITATYDALGRMLTNSSPQGTLNYQYDLANRRTRLTWPDAIYVGYDYLVTGEMTAIRENGAASGIGVLATFAYDNLGRRTSLTRGNGTSTSYGYDAVSRLTSLDQNLTGTSADQSQTFPSYNPAGQIMSRTSSNDSYAWTEAVNVNRPYTSNGLNQYTLTGTITPTYDTKGNLTSAGTGTYTYNGDNQLISAGGTLAAALAYDPVDRLYQTTAGTTTRFAYDGSDLIAEYDGSNAMLRRYVHGPGVDEPLVWYEGSDTTDRRWLHTDERGSVTAVSNAAGSSIATNSYDEYGIPQSTNIGRFQYTGQTWLPELGLYYYKARFYSATLGRFLQTDPIGYAGGMNIYAYVGGDPINLVDPTGLCEELLLDDGCEITVTGKRSVQETAVRWPTILEVSPNASSLPKTTVLAGGEPLREKVRCTDSQQKKMAVADGLDDAGEFFEALGYTELGLGGVALFVPGLQGAAGPAFKAGVGSLALSTGLGIAADGVRASAGFPEYISIDRYVDRVVDKWVPGSGKVMDMIRDALSDEVSDRVNKAIAFRCAQNG